MQLLFAMPLAFQNQLCLGVMFTVVRTLLEMCWQLQILADIKQESTDVKQVIHAGMLQNLQQLTYSVSELLLPNLSLMLCLSIDYFGVYIFH